jgi:hypothetical protein
MRIVKEENPEIINQSFDMNCRMDLRIRMSEAEKLQSRLVKVETLKVKDKK